MPPGIDRIGIVPPPQGRFGRIFPHSVGRDRDIPPTTPPERATARLCGRSLVVVAEANRWRRVLVDVAQKPGSGHVSARVVTLSSAAR